ncbi:DNA topoisomerase 3-beta [Linum grandiflorum]
MSKVELFEGKTAPPDYLSESELISLMEKYGIGTDASIPVHINNICERNYLQVQAGRKLVPTPLGITLIRGYQRIDPDLCLPDIRSFIEQQIMLVAKGQAEHSRVALHVLQQFKQKFAYFVKQFSPLVDSGKALSKCEGKSFPLCPYCYNNPPFEGIDALFGAAKTGNSKDRKLGKGVGMPCFLCPHPTCRHSVIAQGVCACPECSRTLVLDPVSAPKWRLYCNMCNCLVLLPQGAHKISTTDERCSECDSKIIEVDFNKNSTPLKDGSTLHRGCILCDDLLHFVVEVKHGKSFFKRSGGARGRGSWRRGRERRAKNLTEIPALKMGIKLSNLLLKHYPQTPLDFPFVVPECGYNGAKEAVKYIASRAELSDTKKEWIMGKTRRSRIFSVKNQMTFILFGKLIPALVNSFVEASFAAAITSPCE